MSRHGAGRFRSVFNDSFQRLVVGYRNNYRLAANLCLANRTINHAVIFTRSSAGRIYLIFNHRIHGRMIITRPYRFAAIRIHIKTSPC